MRCGCARRMRKQVLPEADYVLHGGVWGCPGIWIGPAGQRIPDDEIEKHYTRLTIGERELRAAAARVAARAARAEAEAFVARLTRGGT